MSKKTLGRSNPSVIWRGADPKQGAAVISRSDLELEPLDIPSLHSTVVPVVISGPAPFLFVGVWTHPPYNEVAQASMMACTDAAGGLPVVAAGDFNSSPAVQGQRQESLWFLQWMQGELGLVSAYHQYSGEAPGEETHPTYYHRWAESAPFHIDYCFVPESWISCLSRVDIGSYAGWRQSDHRPLTVDVTGPAARAETRR